MTTIVADTCCGRLGQSTLRRSAHDSPAKARKPPRRSRLAPVWLFGCVAGLISRPLRARDRSGWAGAWKSLRFRRVRDGRAKLYLVSRCRVWLPHQRQYFFTSKRSGVFRFDFWDW